MSQTNGPPAAIVQSLTRLMAVHRRTPPAVSQSGSPFHDLFEASPDAIFVEDLEGNVLDVNPAACHLHGLERHQLIGRNVQTLVPPDQRAGIVNDFRRVARGELGCLESYSWTSDGRTIPVEIRVRTVMYGDQPAVLLHVRDITERKRAEEALRESEARLNEAQRIAHIGSWEFDLTSQTLSWSDEMYRLHGATREGVTGDVRRYGESMVHPEDREAVLASVARAVEEGGRSQQQYRIRYGDGTVREMLGRAARIDDAAGRPLRLVGTVQDITERKRVERELIKAKEQAEEMNRLKSALLSNISHEVRTPLTAIIGFAEVLADEVNGIQREFARFIEANSRRLFDTLNALLNLTALESADLVPDFEVVDVSLQVCRHVEMQRPRAEAKGLQVYVMPHPSDTWAWLDRGCLDRIVDNLVDNALKFTEQGHLAVKVYTDAACVKVDVSDTGIGISKAFLPHVFDDFSQESVGAGRSFEGIGLGLTITKRLVELMGGTIEVTSERDLGSTVTVSFPRRCPYESAAPISPADP